MATIAVHEKWLTIRGEHESLFKAEQSVINKNSDVLYIYQCIKNNRGIRRFKSVSIRR